MCLLSKIHPPVLLWAKIPPFSEGLWKRCRPRASKTARGQFWTESIQSGRVPTTAELNAAAEAAAEE